MASQGPVSDPAPTRRRVVILAGPSGSGKSRLARSLNSHHHWPVVRLDDFYRDYDDPLLPRRPDLDIADWDHPSSWNAAEARAALVTLVDTGRVDVPTYDIASSRRVGWSAVAATPGSLILAEGIFAAELIADLREAGVLHSSWCVVHRHRLATFAWRLVRDLGERRKAPAVLLRRGWALLRAEPALVDRQRELGAQVSTASQIVTALGPATAARG